MTDEELVSLMKEEFREELSHKKFMEEIQKLRGDGAELLEDGEAELQLLQ